MIDQFVLVMALVLPHPIVLVSITGKEQCVKIVQQVSLEMTANPVTKITLERDVMFQSVTALQLIMKVFALEMASALSPLYVFVLVFGLELIVILVQKSIQDRLVMCQFVME